MDIKVLVATHKKYWMPNNEVYLPIQLGKDIHEDLGLLGDNTGDNISKKQPYYSELTAIYWAWKNLKADYIGINHYRRYFSNEKNIFFKVGDKEKIFKYEDFSNILDEYPVILPKKRHYYIVSRYKQYKDAHDIKDLILCKNVIKNIYPEYLNTFELIINKKSGHILNMFVMRYDIFCDYCKWLFDILFELEKMVDLKNYDEYQQRVFGYIAERLLDVWIDYNNILYKEVNYVMIEKIDFKKKLITFLKRSFVNGKH